MSPLILLSSPHQLGWQAFALIALQQHHYTRQVIWYSIWQMFGAIHRPKWQPPENMETADPARRGRVSYFQKCSLTSVATTVDATHLPGADSALITFIAQDACLLLPCSDFATWALNNAAESTASSTKASLFAYLRMLRLVSWMLLYGRWWRTTPCFVLGFAGMRIMAGCSKCNVILRNPSSWSLM